MVPPENSKEQVGKSVKSRYRPWLSDFFKLKAFTGQRNMDIAKLKWNMIHYENDLPIYIASPNTKVNKQKNNFTIEEIEYVYIPIGEELKTVLLDMGLNKNKHTDKYLILPEVNNRKTTEKQASISFSFYWKKLNKSYFRSLTHLRKTYATRERIFNNSSITTLHSNVKTTERYYIDDVEIVKQMVSDGFRVFPEK